MQYTKYYGIMQSLCVLDTSPMDGLSYEEMIFDYVEEKHIKEYSLLDVEQIAIAQKRGTFQVAAAGNTTAAGGLQSVNTELNTTEEAGAEQSQLPLILAETEECAEDGGKRLRNMGAPVASTAFYIQEIRPLEDRPRRLFVEGTVDTARNAVSSLCDGILDEVLGLQGLIE